MSKILVVDDKRDSREPIVRLLQSAGYEALRAATATEAMAVVQREPLDAMILDVMIPPMDGLTFLWLLRENPQYRKLPVILMTGLCDPHTRERARELGVVDYLVKGSFTPAQLLDAVGRAAQPAAVPPPATQS